MSRYPEHDKLLAVKTERDAVEAFLHWLDEQDLTLCAPPSEDGEHYWPTPLSRATMIARHFDIDPERLEQEKQHMLHELRNPSPTPTP